MPLDDGGSRLPVLHVDYSHLFRGVRLTAAASALPDPIVPAAVLLSLNDGIDVEGELLAGRQDDDLALAVPAYRTATGHLVAAAVWTVSEVSRDDREEQISIKLGPRFNAPTA
ncbi:MAG: hypothetical protein QM650_01145 [Microlunatus sp.]